MSACSVNQVGFCVNASWAHKSDLSWEPQWQDLYFTNNVQKYKQDDINVEIRISANLITRDEGANESKGTRYTGCNFFGCQLEQADCNHYIHGCFNKGYCPIIRLLEFHAVLLILNSQMQPRIIAGSK